MSWGLRKGAGPEQSRAEGFQMEEVWDGETEAESFSTRRGRGGGWAHSGKTSEQGSHSECKGAGAGEVRQVTPESQSRTERGDWHC